MKKISRLLAIFLIISSVTVNSNRASATAELTIETAAQLFPNASVYLISGATVVGEAVVSDISAAATFGSLVVGALAGAAIGKSVELLIVNRTAIGEFFGGVFHGMRTAGADRNKLEFFLNPLVTPKKFADAAEDAHKFLKLYAGRHGTINLDDGFRYTIDGAVYELRKFRADTDPASDTWNEQAALPYHRGFMERAMNRTRRAQDFFGVVNELIDLHIGGIDMTYRDGALYYFVNPQNDDRDKFVMKVQIPQGGVQVAQVVPDRDVVIDMHNLRDPVPLVQADDEEEHPPVAVVLQDAQHGDVEQAFVQGGHVVLGGAAVMEEVDLHDDE